MRVCDYMYKYKIFSQKFFNFLTFPISHHARLVFGKLDIGIVHKSNFDKAQNRFSTPFFNMLIPKVLPLKPSTFGILTGTNKIGEIKMKKTIK